MHYYLFLAHFRTQLVNVRRLACINWNFTNATGKGKIETQNSQNIFFAPTAPKKNPSVFKCYRLRYYNLLPCGTFSRHEWPAWNPRLPSPHHSSKATNRDTITTRTTTKVNQQRQPQDKGKRQPGIIFWQQRVPFEGHKNNTWQQPSPYWQGIHGESLTLWNASENIAIK